MAKKNIVKVFSIVIVLLAIFVLAKALSPGSYNGVMKFKIDISENEAIVKIDSIKKTSNSYRYLKDRGYIDGRKDEYDHWYHFYIYYADTDEVLNCWVREDYSGEATIALVSINIDSKWKRLDKDFDRTEKRVIKKRFIKEVISLMK